MMESSKSDAKEFERFGKVYGQGADDKVVWANGKKRDKAKNKRAKKARRLNR